MKKSYKNIIQKYIILKISSGEWDSGFRIPSENEMSMKFNCSRLSAREAMQSLAYSGVLVPKKGSGYIVSRIDNETFLQPFSVSHNTWKTKIQAVEDDLWIKRFFGLTESGKEKTIMKSYYDKKGILAIQFTILNKNIIWNLDKKSMEKSITSFLASQGVAIKYSNIRITTQNQGIEEVQEIGTSLGWKVPFFPIEIISSFSNEGWVEKSIRITRIDIFNFAFTKRNYL